MFCYKLLNKQFVLHDCFVGRSCRIRQQHLFRRGKSHPTPLSLSVLGITLNCIRWLGSNSGATGNVKYARIAITPGLLWPVFVVPVRVPSTVSACPLISKSSGSLTNPLGIVPSALTTISITVTFIFHSFLSSLARSRYLSLFSPSFILWAVETAKSTIQQVLFFLLTLTRPGRLAKIRRSVVFGTFDPAKNAIPRWCTGRKWHILMAVMRGNRVGGNWLMKWDEVKNPMILS